VLALWLYEVVNIVELAVRKGSITEENARFSGKHRGLAHRDRKSDPTTRLHLRPRAG